jgi:hypothetical protein
VTEKVSGLAADFPRQITQGAPMQIPDWETLFGSLSFCDCSDCRSVYSPAAYFVDLMHFLSKSGENSQGQTPLDVLLIRRPDLPYLKLNCENTNTELPYVDLVNEILETYVAAGHLDKSARNTGDSSADELAANPQYINNSAYDQLKKAIYPLTLPFNQPLEVVRTYLEHLGSSRYEVMQVFQGQPTAATPYALAAEYLKISPEEYQVLTGNNFDGTTALAHLPLEFYGYGQGQHPNPDPNNPTQSGSWEQFLTWVPECLQRTGIAYTDLIELVKTWFINPDQAITLDIPVDADPCDLTQTTIKNLDDATLSKLHRFIRLWRKLGWKVSDLDQAIAALDASDIDDTFLLKLASVKQLQADLKLPLDQLLSFWADIGTQGRDSLYIRLFQNRAVITPIDPVTPIDPAFALTYAAFLASLPATISFRDELAGKISYDSAAKELRFLGMMSADERATLLSLSTDGSYRLAVQDLFAMRKAEGIGPAIPSSDPRLRIPLAPSRGPLGHVERPLLPAPKISEHTNAVLAALRLRAIDLAALTATEVTDDALTLANLSKLYRWSVLARALQLSVSDVLSLKALLGSDPFADPAGTVEFIQRVRRALRSKFSVAQLNYLFRDLYDPNGGIAPLDANIDLLLTGLQTGLAKIAADNTPAPDPKGDLLRQKLGALLDSSVLDAAMALISGVAVYSAPLPTLPNITFPRALSGKISYDSQSRRLCFVGAMTDAQQKQLSGLSADAGYQAAINSLAQQPRDFITTHFIGNFPGLVDSGAYAADLASLPALTFPRALKSKVTYDATAQRLLFTGAMTDLERTQLESLFPNDAGYTAAIESLYQQAQSFQSLAAPPDPSDLIANIISNASLGAADRFYYFLTRVMAYLRDSTSRSLIKQTFSDNLKLDTQTVQLLLETLLKSQADSSKTAMANFPPLATSGPSDPARNSYRLLYKVALLVNGFKMTFAEVEYLYKHSADFADFDFGALPLNRSNALQSDAKAVNLFAQWERLNDLFTLRDNWSQGQVTLFDVFGTASQDDAQKYLTAVSGWDPQQIVQLVAGFRLSPADFKNEIALVKLRRAWALVKRLGVSADQLFTWANSEPDPAQAQDVKNTVKAKYDDQTWLTVAKALNDGLRAKQRDALLAYVLTMSAIVQQGIRNSNELYEYFLIDVNMSACMMTSRIVQATAAIQLFVQRCLMNLEMEVQPTQIDAKQWEWMKLYRVWEANREVFLYPENWIMPELRDDKSSFFKELESELLQNDLTADAAEEAYLHYLEKLDDVARLEICGIYWQDETDAQTNNETNILHVFGRTRAKPHVYYYRRLTSDNVWTAWEKVELDIQGDHLIPVVWNRRLYLFWPVFTQKKTEPPPGQTPQNYWEITLAWSEYKPDGWQPKKVLLQLITTQSDLFDQSQHSFKVLVDNGDLLIQTFCEGNFIAELRVPSFQGGLTLNYTADPQYSQAMVPAAYTDFTEKPGTTQESISLQVQPYGGAFYFMSFYEQVFPTGQLVLRAGNWGDQPDADAIPDSAVTAIQALGNTPAYFLLCSHQFHQFALQAPFFYEDDRRTYFVAPDMVCDFPAVMNGPDVVTPGVGGLLAPVVSHSIAGAGGRTLPANVAPHPIANTGLRSVGGPLNSTAGSSSPTISWGMRQSPSAGLLAGHSWVGNLCLNAATDLKFQIYYHPYVGDFIKAVNGDGLPGLLTLANQTANDIGYYATDPDADTRYYGPYFGFFYNPQKAVEQPFPTEEVDFSYCGSYSLYNWELFFHIPLLIATRLTQNQRFDQARQWLHYIFNPTTDSADPVPERYWNVLPFHQKPEWGRIEDLLRALADPHTDPATRQELHNQVSEWQNNPFNPHFIARLRPVAYQKMVVMKYLDNLIAWGDYLFNQNTRESINEAEQLYVLASEILGPRPERIPQRGTIQEYTYSDLQRYLLGDFSNPLVALENEFPFGATPPAQSGGSAGLSGGLGFSSTLYFCVPQNDQLLGYWDTVADRLFKIRHCMTIEGVVEQLPLFAPPIEPGLLVQAVAAGVDLASVLADISAPVPYYRFGYMLQRALELGAEVRALGAALLSALEKSDAEALSLLRASQETSLLKAVRDVKQRQLDEANANLAGLQQSRDAACYRYRRYQQLLALSGSCPAPNAAIAELATPGSPVLNANETEYLAQLGYAEQRQQDAAMVEIAAQITHLLIPDFSFGFPSGTTMSYGGSNIGAALYAWARSINSLASDHTFQANAASAMAGYARRTEEWDFQMNLAGKELMQIDKQIAAANIRIQMAQKELDNQDQQIDNASAIEDFLRNKYTSQDLYDWMASQISTVYFQCYQMAYGLAKRAERAFRFERGLTDSNYIQFGYWDSLKKGLLSGERLYLDLKRLEMAYLDQNKREYEIAKHMSLVLTNPMALIALKQTGQCIVELSEALFDADYPGHYMRRIKSVSLTIPAVTGPYTSVNCTLTLLKSSIRVKSDPAGSEGNYVRDQNSDDPRFVDNFSALESIATSHGQNDTGMFELNFRDERYLPFEGQGAISIWQIDMPRDTNAFDFETISDVVINLNYTARDGGETLRQAARAEVVGRRQDGVLRLFSLKHEFPSEWYRFLQPPDTADRQSMMINLTMERFPFQFRGRTIQIAQMELFLKFKDIHDTNTYTQGGTPLGDYNSNPLVVSLIAPGDNTGPSGSLVSDSAVLAGLPHTLIDFTNQPKGLGAWSLQVKDSDIHSIAASLQVPVTANGTPHYRLKAEVVEDIVMICHYSAA